MQSGLHNAAVLVSAVPSTSADDDLYLQRQNPEGSWSVDVTSGGSSSLTQERLWFGAPEPGPAA